MVSVQRVVAILLAAAAGATLMGAAFFLVAAGEATFIAQSFLFSIGLLGLVGGLGIAGASYLSFRGGALAQGITLALSALILLRVLPYFVLIVLRGDDLSWVGPVGAVVVVFGIAFVASGVGLLRRARRR